MVFVFEMAAKLLKNNNNNSNNNNNKQSKAKQTKKNIYILNPWLL